MDIRIWPDEILGQEAETVTEFGPELLKTGHAMMSFLESTGNGIGLAANQVGLLQRMFVFYDEDRITQTLVVNPIVTLSGPVVDMREGCLSLPGIYEQVLRPRDLRLEFQHALDGSPRNLELTGLEARVVQHEIDHLDGKMFFTRLSRPLRKGVLSKWEKKSVCLT
jgi:peptide deformylase